MEFFLEAEDLIEATSSLRMSLFKGKAQNLHFRPLDILWKLGRRARNSDTDLFSKDELLRVGKAREDSSMDRFDNALKLDKLTRRREIRTALIPGIGGKQGAIGGNDLVG